MVAKWKAKTTNGDLAHYFAYPMTDASEHLGINLHTIGTAMHCNRLTHGLRFSHDKEKSPK